MRLGKTESENLLLLIALVAAIGAGLMIAIQAYYHQLTLLLPMLVLFGVAIGCIGLEFHLSKRRLKEEEEAEEKDWKQDE